MSDIAAIKCTSLSELFAVDNKYTEMWAMQNQAELEQILYDSGLDTNEYFEHQVNTHRNQLNQVYTGSRWTGMERTDKAWIESGYASREAKDRAKGSKLLNDLYRSRGLTMDRTAGVFQAEDFEKPDYVESTDLHEYQETAVNTDLIDLEIQLEVEQAMKENTINKEQDAESRN